MLTAASVPALRYLAIAAGLTGAGVVASSLHSDPKPHRLHLDAVDEPNCVYLSAFRNGDITMAFDVDDMPMITAKVTAEVSDGCTWLGTETLIPIDRTMFLYDYKETILSCEPGATPARKTPRTGLVTIVE